MNLRSGAMPEPGSPAPSAPGGPAPTSVSWRVAPALTVFKGIGALLFAGAAALYAADPTRLVIAGLAAALLATYAVRDVVLPVRLAADADGLTVPSGYAGRRRIGWADVERIRVDERRRFGTRAQLLEVDTGASLHLFNTYELSAPVEDVADELRRLRTGRGAGAG